MSSFQNSVRLENQKSITPMNPNVGWVDVLSLSRQPQIFLEGSKHRDSKLDYQKLLLCTVGDNNYCIPYQRY